MLSFYGFIYNPTGGKPLSPKFKPQLRQWCLAIDTLNLWLDTSPPQGIWKKSAINRLRVLSSLDVLACVMTFNVHSYVDESKGKVSTIYIAPPASQRTRLQRRSASQTWSSQPTPQAMPAHTDFGHCGRAATRNPSLPYNVMVSTPRNPSCNYMDYYSFTDSGRIEGWVGVAHCEPLMQRTLHSRLKVGYINIARIRHVSIKRRWGDIILNWDLLYAKTHWRSKYRTEQTSLGILNVLAYMVAQKSKPFRVIIKSCWIMLLHASEISFFSSN